MARIERYIPTIGKAPWDIKELSREERENIFKRLEVRTTHSEKEYQTVIGYIHSKYNDLMDANPAGMNLQWNYSVAKNKAEVENKETGEKFDMYAFAYYDPERDMEPVAFGGSYFKKAKPIDDSQEVDEHGEITIGFGYVLFVDPDYRRMGIADAMWVAESELYRKNGIRYQREIQNEDSLKVTQAMFDDKEKCIITSPGRLKNDGTRCQIRCLLDYTDESLIRSYKELPDNAKDFSKGFDFKFLDREGLSVEELTKIWNK